MDLRELPLFMKVFNFSVSTNEETSKLYKIPDYKNGIYGLDDCKKNLMTLIMRHRYTQNVYEQTISFPKVLYISGRQGVGKRTLLRAFCKYTKICLVEVEQPPYEVNLIQKIFLVVKKIECRKMFYTFS